MVRAVSSRKEELWRARLQRFQISGLSVTQFCERERVSQPSFYQWRKRLAGSVAVPSPSPFVPVRLTQVTAVAINLPNGTQILVPPGSSDDLRVAIEAAGRCQAGNGNREADTCSR